MSYCSNCGSKLENDALFCEECGTRVCHKDHATDDIIREVVNEFNRQYYIEELITTMIYAVLAMVGAAIVLKILGVESILEALVVGLGFAGIPSGWAVLNKIFGGFIFGGIIGLFLLIIHFFLAVLIGWIALPIKIVYNIFKIIQATNS